MKTVSVLFFVSGLTFVGGLLMWFFYVEIAKVCLMTGALTFFIGMAVAVFNKHQKLP